MICNLEFKRQNQEDISNVFTPNIQITNSVSNCKNLFKSKQNNSDSSQLQSGVQLTYRILPRSNSDQEIYEKSSENYMSLFKSQVDIHQQSASSSSSTQAGVSISSIQFSKSKSMKEHKDDATCQLSPTSTSSAQTQSLKTKKFSQLKKKTSIEDSLSSTSTNTTTTTKVVRPFPEHEFLISADNFTKQNSSITEEDDSFLLYPVIQVNGLQKNIQYVEYNKKKGCLSVHLQNKLSSVCIESQTSIFEEVPSTNGLFGDNLELNTAINNLTRQLKNLPKAVQPFSHSLLESETYKVIQKPKACLCLAYRMNESGSFEVKGVHMNEKFLIYTKWDADNCMMATLNSSIQEMFTARNYDTFITNTFKSMSAAINEKSSSTSTSPSCSFIGELRMSDNGVREVEMTVESTYSAKNGFLFVNYIIDKVISERKAVQQKKKSKSSSSSTSFKQEKQISGEFRSKSNSNTTTKRKASNSFTFEETTICNDEEPLSQQDKNFLQRYYSM